MCSSTIASEPIGPFGETLTCPSAASGAVATKNIVCRATQSRRGATMPSKTFATRARLEHAMMRP